MKTSFDHMPPFKQAELEHVQRVLMEGFERAIAGGTQPWRRNGKIMKIILFGSFARGDWVDEPWNGYRSDWDLLIIVSHEKLTPIEDFWWETEEKLLGDRRVKRPVNIIVHTLQEVNGRSQGANISGWISHAKASCCSNGPVTRSQARSR